MRIPPPPTPHLFVVVVVVVVVEEATVCKNGKGFCIRIFSDKTYLGIYGLIPYERCACI